MNKTNNNFHNSLSYADCVIVKTNSDLFSVDELFNIFTTALHDLSKCTTKIQQIQIYVHGEIRLWSSIMNLI